MIFQGEKLIMCIYSTVAWRVAVLHSTIPSVEKPEITFELTIANMFFFPCKDLPK